MTTLQLHTPIAFLIFNRPDTTARVFEAIRKARPPKLLVVADGPRADRPGEAEKCEATRAIINGVDWPCKVLTNYSNVNLGCKGRVSSGLDWVFSNVEEAIILEDDCLPHPTFFRFCEELLNKYRDDQRVMMISGDNFQFGRKRTFYSYYFSHYTHIWGWASWRRAWKYYDVRMKLWPQIMQGGWLHGRSYDKKDVRIWTDIFDKVYIGEIDTWDYQWTFACWINNGLTILPHVNLVTNIGCNPGGTHVQDVSNPVANLKTVAMTFPLKHPDFMIRDQEADGWTQRSILSPDKRTRIMNKLRKLLSLFRT
jgi:hypothetical protein